MEGETISFDAAPVSDDEQRPGRLHVTFAPWMGLDEADRVVRMPRYEAGHMIPMTRPSELREDLRDFLTERGAYTP